MYEKHQFTQEEIKKRAAELGLKAKDDNTFVLLVEDKPENELQLLVVELERRGFKKIEEDTDPEQSPKEILFAYDASLASPRE